MLRITMPLLMLFANADISVYDSKTDPKVSYVLVDDCAVPVLKSDFNSKDECIIINKVNEFCHLFLKPDKCSRDK